MSWRCLLGLGRRSFEHLEALMGIRQRHSLHFVEATQYNMHPPLGTWFQEPCKHRGLRLGQLTYPVILTTATALAAKQRAKAGRTCKLRTRRVRLAAEGFPQSVPGQSRTFFGVGCMLQGDPPQKKYTREGHEPFWKKGDRPGSCFSYLQAHIFWMFVFMPWWWLSNCHDWISRGCFFPQLTVLTFASNWRMKTGNVQMLMLKFAPPCHGRKKCGYITLFKNMQYSMI